MNKPWSRVGRSTGVWYGMCCRTGRRCSSAQDYRTVVGGVGVAGRPRWFPRSVSRHYFQHILHVCHCLGIWRNSDGHSPRVGAATCRGLKCSTYRVTCRGRNGGLFHTISNAWVGDFSFLTWCSGLGWQMGLSLRGVARSGVKCLFLTRIAVWWSCLLVHFDIFLVQGSPWLVVPSFPGRNDERFGDLRFIVSSLANLSRALEATIHQLLCHSATAALT